MPNVVEILRGVLTGVVKEHLIAAWMLFEELGHVIDLVVKDDPAVVRGLVLGNVGASELLHFSITDQPKT